MATTTSNLGLSKPLGTEQYDVNVFNGNADLLDAEFGATGGHAHTGVGGEGAQIGTNGLANLAVSSAKLADGAVTGAKFAAGAFQAAQFENLALNGGFESWSGGTNAAPDGWSLSGAGAAVAREATIVRRGTYSAALTRSGTNALLRFAALANAGGGGYIDGRTYSFGAWVYATVPGRVRLSIQDGVGSSYSSYHTGGSAWEWLTVTRALDASATALTADFWVDTGDATGYIDGAIVVEGPQAPAFFPHPNDAHLRLSNFQDSTPTNHLDRGLWRMEVGQVSMAGNTGATFATKTVTFESAFRTALGAVVMPTADVGGDRVHAYAQSLAASSFVAIAATTDQVVFGSTASATLHWMAWGIG